ncbi:MAG: LysE family transporter [Bacteroidota bacterium]
MFTTFIIAFFFSFIGSIPPGTLNLSVIQLSLDNKLKAAIRFSLAAAIIEFPYAFIAVKFENLITSSPIVLNNFKLIAAVVMISLGTVNLITYSKPSTSDTLEKLKQSGFRKGVILSILNPLAIPFWVGVTAYLNHQQWIVLTGNWSITIYVLGISFGTFSLLALLALLSQYLGGLFRKKSLIQIIPGIIFLILGLYALLEYLSIL